jgi:antitoxin protein of toxin-antitoxin system
MGLMDKAKGLIEEHRGQVEQGLHKATDKFNKLAGGQSSPTAAPPNEAASDPAVTATEAQTDGSTAEAVQADGAASESPDAQ